jgi:Lon protease-like protein
MERSEEIPLDDLVELPLFPLNVVLFPGMVLPLHIFEERYKSMMGDCIERQVPFGVALIKEGQEVGPPAEPLGVGTSARIIRVDRLEDGRMNLLTLGEKRFETAEIIQRRPHVIGQVRYLREEAGEVASEILAEIREGFSTFLRNLSTLSGGWSSQPEVPQEPVELSYGVAARLDLPQNLGQALLESSTAGERLERLVPLLRQGNHALEEHIAKRNPFQGPRLN